MQTTNTATKSTTTSQRQAAPDSSASAGKADRSELRGMSYAEGAARLAPDAKGAADPFAQGPRVTDKVKGKKDLALGSGKATISQERIRQEQTADGYAQTRVGGKVGYEGGVVAEGKLSQIEGDASAKRERTLEGGLGKGGPRLGVKQTDTLMAGSKNQQSTTRGLAYEDGQVAASQASKSSWKNPDGTVRESTSSMKLAMGPGGPTFGAGKSDVTTQKDGSKTTDSASVSGNVLKGELAGSMGTVTKGKDGKVQSAANVSGGVKVDKSGAIRSANLKGGVQRKGTSVSAGVAYDVTAEAPVAVDGGFVVVWTKTKSGSASVGASAGAASARVGGELHKTKTGRAVFETEAAAQKFADNVASELAHIQTDVPTDLADIEHMKVGEEITAESGRSMNASVSGKLAGATATLGGASGSGKSRTVRKVSASEVEIEVERSEFDKFDASIGLGATLGTSSSTTESHAVIVRFDLSKPAGKEALAQFQAGQKVTASGGITSITSVTRKGSESKGGLTAPKLAIGNTATTQEAIAVGSNGTRKGEFTGTNVKSVSAAIPWAGGKQMVSTGIRERSDMNNAVSYDVTSKVDDSRGADARGDLAAATGTETVSGSAKRSGAWVVSSEFSPRDIDAFTARVTSPSGDTSALLGKQGYGQTLVASLRAAKGVEDRMRAISAFVAHAGPRGLQVIRDNIGRYRGGKAQGFDLQLDGDPWFQGPEARRALEARLGAYRSAIGDASADLPQVLAGVAKDAAWAAGRLRVLEDAKRYSDLPSELRGVEVQRTAGWSRALDALQKQLYQAMAARRASEQATANDPATVSAVGPVMAQKKGGTAPKTSDKKGASDGKADAAGSQEAAAMVSIEARASAVEAQVSDADERLRALTQDARAAKALVAKSRWVHYRNPFGDSGPAVKRIGDPTSKASYERGQRHWPWANGQLDASAKHADRANALRAIAYQQTTAATRASMLQSVLRALEQALTFALSAKRSYDMQERDYRAIAARYQRYDHEIWGGYDATMPPGEVT